MGNESTILVRLTGRSICSKKVMIEGRDVDSNMNGFSSFVGGLFVIFIFYLEVGDVGSGMIFGNSVAGKLYW